MSHQVMSVVPLEKGKAGIRFDDGTEVVLYKGEIRKLGIEEGCVVTEAVYDKILNEILGKRAIRRAMHLLEKQESGLMMGQKLFFIKERFESLG